MLRFITVIAAVALCGTASAKPFFSYEMPTPGNEKYKVPGGFMMMSNCGGCPSGDKGTQLAPAVIEYIIASQPSPIRSHYENYSKYRVGQINGAIKKAPTIGGFFQVDGHPAGDLKETSKNPLLQGQFEVDVAFLSATDDALSSPSDAILASVEDGVPLARAAGRVTADGAEAMFEKFGRAQWFWGYRWEDDGGGYKTPTVAGIYMVLVVPNAEEKTASMHVFAAGHSVRDVHAKWDLSAIDGAFDANSTVDYDTVAGAIKESGKE